MAEAVYDPDFLKGTTVSQDDSEGVYDPDFLDDMPAPAPARKEVEDKPTAGGAATRTVVGRVVPILVGAAIGAKTGYATGAALGAAHPLTRTVGAFGGGLVGMLVGGYAASRAQEEVFEAAPSLARAVGQSPEQRAADMEAHPEVVKWAGIGSEFLTGRPSVKSAKGVVSLLMPSASAASKEIGKSALKVGAFNAALEGGVSAGVDAATNDGPTDWTSILGDATVGALGQKTTRLGRMVGLTDGVAPRPPAPGPAPVGQPPAPLMLPAPYDVPHTDGRVFTASETGLVSADDNNIRRAANEAAPVGTQGDLFALGGEDTTQTPRPGLEVSQPVDRGPPSDQGGQAPVPMDQPSLFSDAPTATVAPQFGPVEVRRAVIGGDKPDAWGLKVAQKVHTLLKDGDTVGAAAYVEEQGEALAFANVKPKTIDTRLGQLARARTLVADYTSKMTNALAEEGVQKAKQPPADNLSPAPVEPSVAAIREDNAARTAAEAQQPAKPGPTDDAVAHANQVAEDGRRQSILQHVLSDPTTISPAKRFAALLKRQNLDPTPRAYEKDEIISSLVRKGRAEEAKTAFEGLTESGNPPDTEGGAAPLEKFIPERQPKPVAAPAAAAPIKAPAKDTFKLEPQTEGDLRAIEAARVRREGKAERRDAAAEAAKPAAAQGELFTPKGNPTKVAADAAKRPPLPKDAAPVVVKKSAKPTTKRPQLPKDKANGQENAAPVRKEGRDDARQEVQAGREKEVGGYTAVKKRADAAVAARSITPKQHGMVEAAIAAKSHTPEELGKELDKILTRGSEKVFESPTRRGDLKSNNASNEGGAPRIHELVDTSADTHTLLSHVEKEAGNPLFKTLATALRSVLPRSVKVAHIPVKFLDSTLEGYYSLSEDAIYLARDAVGATRAFLHEAVHAATAHAIETKSDMGKDIIQLFESYKKILGQGRYKKYRDDYGFTTAHEFVAELHTNDNFVAILKDLRENGQTLWSKFVNAVRKGLGLKANNDIEKLYELHARVSDPAMLAEAAKARTATLEGPTLESVVRRNIAAAPKEQRENLRRLARIADVKLTKGLSAIAMGNHVYDMAVNRGITYARTLQRVTAERIAAANALLQPHLRLIEMARNLPQETLKEVNRLIQDSTSSEKFAFYPAYLRVAVPDVTAPGGVKYVVSRKAGMNVPVDPALNARYKALPPEARKVVTEAFRVSHDRLYDEKNAVLSHVATSYDGMIADTQKILTTTTDIKKRGALIADIKKFNAEKVQALKGYASLLSIDPNRPYAPMTRNGNWVVTAKSDAYLAAEARGDVAALTKMQKDPAHYFVDFTATHSEGYKLADSIQSKYGNTDQNVFIQERNKFADKLYAGRDMTMAVQRLENLARQAGVSPATRALINDLKLNTLSQNSIRRSEMQRLNVASGDLDMLRNIMAHGKSAAHFIGNLYHAEEVLDALSRVKKEVDYPGGKQTRTGRDDRQAIVNELTARYEKDLNRSSDDDTLGRMTASKINSMTSLYMLAVKPMYYVQQLFQTPMYSAPLMEGRFGPVNTIKALGNAYGVVAKALDAQSGLTNLDQIDISKLPPKYQPMADYMYQSGIFDVGINTEMGETINASSGAAAVGEQVMDKVRGLSRKVEAINRLTAGIAQYDLDMANPGKRQVQHDPGAYAAYLRDFDRLKDVQGHNFQPLTKDQFTAADNAVRLVRDSHGDLSSANSPGYLNNSVGRVVLQYKKFPLIMAGMMGREIHKVFLGSHVSPIERVVARKTLGYLLGHTAFMAGVSGSIGYNIVSILYNMVMSAMSDEPRDMEVDIRKAIGDPMIADLILKGAPTLGGADLSGTLGMGNLLSVAPFADVPKDRATWEKFLVSTSGPFLGGLVSRAWDGVSYWRQGDYYKMFENVTPRGVSDVMRAYRERTEGVTNKRGELLVDPESIPSMSTLWRAMGAQSLDQANRSKAADIKFKQDDYYKAKVVDVKRDYIRAVEADDAAAKAEARDAWKKLQDDRVEHGLKRQPFSDLLKAPRDKAKRERNTEGGMQFTNRDEGAVQELTDLFSQDVEDDADDADLQNALRN